MKNKNELKELYHKYIINNKINIETYQDIVKKINKEKKINIKTVVIHSGEEDETAQSLATLKHLSQKNDDKKTQEAKKLEKILNEAKESEEPTGILVIVVNQKDQIQHVNGFVIGGKSKQINGKPILTINRDTNLAYIDFYINSLFTCIFNKFQTNLTKEQQQGKQSWTIPWLRELAIKNIAFAKDFSYIVPQPTQKSHDSTCIVDSLIFCEKMLKNKAKQFDEFIDNKTPHDAENNQYTSKLPLSIMKYTQERNKQDNKYFDDIIKNDYDIDDKKNKKSFDKLKHYTCEFTDENGYHKHNNLPYIKLFKLLNKIDSENQEIKDIITTYGYYKPSEKIKNFINNGSNIETKDITPEAIIEYLSNDMFFKNKGNNWTRRWNGKKRRYHAFVRALKNASKNQNSNNYLHMRDLDEINGNLSDEIKTKIENIFKSKPTNNLEEDKKEGEVKQEQNNIQPNLKKKKKKKGKKKKGNTTKQINLQNRQQEINNEDSKRHLKAIQEQIHNALNQTGCGCF